MIPPRDNIIFDLDQSFAGVDERSDGGAMPGSSEVQNGARVASAQNVRFTGRTIETRSGYLWSPRYNPHGTQDQDSTPTGSVITGAGSYVDPQTGLEYLMISRTYLGTIAPPPEIGVTDPERLVWLCRDDVAPVSISSSDPDRSYDDREPNLVRFTQLGGDVVMWRRDGKSPLIWDGDRSGSFQPAQDVDPNPDTPDYYEPIPSREFAVVAGDRLVFPHEGGIGYTDIFEARKWDRATAAITVGDDGGDVTGLLWWRGSTLLVFKRSSVWAIENFYGDLSQASVGATPLTRQAGCIAPDTITEVAGDVMWLGNGGVYSLSKVLDTDKQVNTVPVSYLIPRTMDRINWSKAHLASAVLSREVWVLAVPLDGALRPDTLLVWNSISAEWQGKDVPGGDYGTGEYVALRRCRLFGRETYSLVRGLEVLTAGWSWRDHGDSGDGDIATSVRFRGYHAAEHGKVRWVRMEVETEELGTEGVTFTAAGDGIGTVIPLQGATTRDRTKWLAYGRTIRDTTNDDNDFNDPGREDYSWVLGGTKQVETATVIGTVTGSGNATVVLTSSGMTGSPITLAVAVLNTDTASAVATKIRTALEGNAVIDARFVIGGTGAAIILTLKAVAANDATLNLSINNGTCTGLTPALTSISTTAGVAGESGCLNTTGIIPGQLQAHVLRGNVTGLARTLAPVITTTAGRLRINVLRAAGVR